MLKSPAAAQQINTVEIYFDFDSAVVDDAADAQLRAFLDAAAENAGRPIRVVGHADAPGSIGYNETLGLRRAEATARRLAALGASEAGLRVETRGETDPRTPVAGRERTNRRVTVARAGCATWRGVTDAEVAAADTAALIAAAISTRAEYAASGGSAGAHQMAAAAVRSCGAAHGYVPDAPRRGEHVRRCVCDSDRMRVAAAIEG